MLKRKGWFSLSLLLTVVVLINVVVITTEKQGSIIAIHESNVVGIVQHKINNELLCRA
jgi:hypothetical protein